MVAAIDPAESPPQRKVGGPRSVGIERVALKHHRHMTAGRRQGGDVRARRAGWAPVGGESSGDQAQGCLLLPSNRWAEQGQATIAGRSTVRIGSSRIVRAPMRRLIPSCNAVGSAGGVLESCGNGQSARSGGQQFNPWMAPWVRPATIAPAMKDQRSKQGNGTLPSTRGPQAKAP